MNRLPFVAFALIVGGVSLLHLAAADEKASKTDDKISVLILTGQNNHDWKKTTPVLKELLEDTGRFTVAVSEDPSQLGAEDFAKHQALLLNYNGKRWGSRTEGAFLQFVRGGGGIVVVHAANNPFADWKEYDEVIGGAWRKNAGHGQFHSFKVDVVDREHPITQGMPASFQHAADELYHRLTMQPNIHLLAEAYDDPSKGGTGKKEPMAWTVEYGKGRVFHTPMGHADSSMRGIGFRSFVERGTEWAATGKVTLSVPEKLDGSLSEK
jgi:type 1 glutamine amidotransferase